MGFRAGIVLGSYAPPEAARAQVERDALLCPVAKTLAPSKAGVVVQLWSGNYIISLIFLIFINLIGIKCNSCFVLHFPDC